MRYDLPAILVAVSVLSCSSPAEPTHDAGPSSVPTPLAKTASASRAESSASASVAIATTTSSPSTSPALPKDVVKCEAGPPGSSMGAWKPSSDDIVAAAKVLDEDVCLKRAELADAVHACAAKVGAATVALSNDDLKGPSGCELEIYTVEEKGRRWVVFATSSRDRSTFSGGTDVVEVSNGGAKPYFKAVMGEEGGPCSEGKLAEKRKPGGWDAISENAKDFFCSGPK